MKHRLSIEESREFIRKGLLPERLSRGRRVGGPVVSKKEGGKYGGRIVEVDLYKFRSATEGDFYKDLKKWASLEIPFPGNPDLGRILDYNVRPGIRVNAKVTIWFDFSIILEAGEFYIDVKGAELRSFIRNMKLLQVYKPEYLKRSLIVKKVGGCWSTEAGEDWILNR